MAVDTEALRATVLDYAVRTLWAVVIAVAAIVLARALRGTTMRALARHRAHANATVLLGNLAQLGVILAGALVIVAIYTQGAFGWILTSLSVIGIVIGLSLQDILKNFFAGVWVLVERPFRIGDTVEVSGYTGVVDQISFRTTQLRTVDGREVIIPNGNLMTSPVINLSRYPQRRAAIWLAVPLDDAATLDEDGIRAVLRELPAVAGDPPPAVDLRSVADGKARFEILVWGSDLEAARTAAMAAVRARFPQGEVHGA